MKGIQDLPVKLTPFLRSGKEGVGAWSIVERLNVT